MRKRGKYRPPAEPGTLPVVWGMSHAAIVQLSLRERTALDALLDGTAVADHYETLEAACESAIWTCDAAAGGPYDIDRGALLELRNRLVQCAQALLGVSERHARLGRYGCSGPERELLLELCDHMESMRAQVPRRCWMAGYRRAITTLQTPVPRPAP